MCDGALDLTELAQRLHCTSRRSKQDLRIETTSDALDQIKTTCSNVMLRNRLIVAMHSQIRSMINVHG